MTYTIKQTLYKFTISASGIIVGTVVASLTYSSIKTLSATMCFFTSKGTFLLSLILGYSTDYLFGSRIGYVVSETINHCSDLFLVKPIDLFSTKTATIASVITGSVAGLTTSLLLSSSSYIISKTSDYYSSYKNPIHQTYTPFHIKYLENNDYLVLEN